MRIKSYFADSVREAIDKARVELGAEAMLMNSKKTDLELRSLGAYEVVFGVVAEPVKAAEGKTAESKKFDKRTQSPLSAEPITGFDRASAAAGTSLPPEVGKELADLRRQLETVKRSVTRQRRAAVTPAQPGLLGHPGASDLCARLLEEDFSDDLAQEIAEAAELRAFAARQPAGRPPRDFEMLPSEMLEMALKTEMERRLQISPELGKTGESLRVVMLAGPAGAGKTTALIKLALRYGLRARVPMHLLSLDTLRVGGWEQLASYARIAGVGFDAVHNWNTLKQVLAQQGNKKLIFIDTPGIGLADKKEMAALDACCAEHGSIDVHVVCPATLRVSAGLRLIERFRSLRPSKLLLTHTDEVDSAGALLELAMSSGLPLSYLSTGQNIPEDIEEAAKEKLLKRFPWRSPTEAASAA